MPEVSRGIAAFLNLALNVYLQKNTSNETVKLLNQYVHNDKIGLYLADMRLPEPGAKDIGAYDLVAVNEKGQTQGFQVQCDKGLQVKGLSEVPMETLSTASIAMFKDLRSEHLARSMEGEPAPASPKIS